MRILVVEDDAETRAYLERGLRESGHVVDSAENGDRGQALAIDAKYDVLIVDRMLPGRDGLSVIESVRQSDIQTPILILSALGEVDDRVKGLVRGDGCRQRSRGAGLRTRAGGRTLLSSRCESYEARGRTRTQSRISGC